MSFKQSKREWQDGFRRHAAQCRITSPIPPRERLSTEEEWHCRIIGGSLIRFLENSFADILKSRKFFAHEFEVPDPRLLVFTSTMPGLVALSEMFDRPVEEIVPVLNEEWADWCDRHPDCKFQYHVLFSSYISAELGRDQRQRIRKEYPHLRMAECRIHHIVEMWGPLAGSSYEHLWRWDGQTLHLIKEGFDQRIS